MKSKEKMKQRELLSRCFSLKGGRAAQACALALLMPPVNAESFSGYPLRVPTGITRDMP
jgi:hypothetical protein